VPVRVRLRAPSDFEWDSSNQSTAFWRPSLRWLRDAGKYVFFSRHLRTQFLSCEIFEQSYRYSIPPRFNVATPTPLFRVSGSSDVRQVGGDAGFGLRSMAEASEEVRIEVLRVLHDGDGLARSSWRSIDLFKRAMRPELWSARLQLDLVGRRGGADGELGPCGVFACIAFDGGDPAGAA